MHAAPTKEQFTQVIICMHSATYAAQLIGNHKLGSGKTEKGSEVFPSIAVRVKPSMQVGGKGNLTSATE